MNMKQTIRRIAGLVLLAAQVFAQGSLSPLGSPAPTMKTLDQIEARTDLATVAGDTFYHHVISKPGSYYLSANVEVTKPRGIWINATDVTLDLNGFRISRASGNAECGINIEDSKDRATVRNGSIVGFRYGILCLAKGSLFEGVSVSGCTGCGFFCTGDWAVFTDCQAHDNLSTGIMAGDGAILRNCTATSNQGSDGIKASSGSHLENCTAYTNDCEAGIRVSSGSSLKNCIAYNNNCTYGIRAGNGSTIEGCSAYNNTGTGVSSYGISAGMCTVVKGCSAYENSNTNSPSSMYQGTGIYANSGSTVKDCSAFANKGDGIVVSYASSVVGNTCCLNGKNGDGAGIRASQYGNRIDSNNITSNDRGIAVDTAGNIIVRNTARGNTTNYDPGTGNDTGTIRTSPVGAGAWDNFSF